MRSRAILKKVLTGQNGIITRHLALEKLEDAFKMDPDALHARFAVNAPVLAAQAATRALEDSRTNPEQIDGLIISTCTGYLCPGLTSYVGQRLKIPLAEKRRCPRDVPRVGLLHRERRRGGDRFLQTRLPR
jgi:alkylresorcinol/alkylpyrone synthase